MLIRYAVIADIVGSRALPDRVQAQRTFTDVLVRAGEGLNLPRSPYATVGDEFQAVADSLGAALTLTLRTQLLLPGVLSLRFGVGAGEARDVGANDGAPVQDGPAWWLAREAIDCAHAAQDAGLGFVRTRVRLGAGAPEDPAGPAACENVREHERVTNAMLTLRDQAVQRMRERPRRLMGRLLMGATQVEAAGAEGVTQSAVSALVRGTGAGLLEAQALLAAVTDDRRGRRVLR
ncbi:SatD family protein [Actinomyces israelii]|uniref:SatD family protein n=1 Tax=Actinomyces israelii TaxID=1659 RepID=A0ABT4I4U5_9ACTO|nr:SatD family protein [Actinomyces israelii]MCZ0856546.1 SatD family protein [Actinomyces israelii]